MSKCATIYYTIAVANNLTTKHEIAGHPLIKFDKWLNGQKDHTSSITKLRIAYLATKQHKTITLFSSNTATTLFVGQPQPSKDLATKSLHLTPPPSTKSLHLGFRVRV